MTQWGQETPVILEAGWQDNIESHVTAAIWMRQDCAFALGDGTVHVHSPNGTKTIVPLHDGACLAAAPLQDGLVTCGDDGKVQKLDRSGITTTLVDEFGRLFDQIATVDWGGIAVADAKRLYVLLPNGTLKKYQTQASVTGLSFAPKGRKLAVSRNNGVNVYWVGTDRTTPDRYEWKGAHGLVTWSPKGDFIVTSMHENALHVWRTDHKKHGRMGGYPARIKSFSWDNKGVSLATSGADGIVIWPFHTKDGPIGQPAEQVPLKTEVIVNAVAFHPTDNQILAVGTAPGDVLLMRRDSSILPIAYDVGSSITCLAFNEDGTKLAFGADEGSYGIADLQTLS